jgi:ubiquinone/menaquinone biosynthesis C-methylase UbiE
MSSLNPSPTNYLQVIPAVCDNLWFMSRLVWMNEENLAQHLGYWDENTRTHAESLLKINEVIADAIKIDRDDRILDAGCGYGGTAMWLAKKYQARVVGVNLSPDQIKRARYYAQKQNLEHLVKFEQQDFLKTQFPDASFDVVWAQESIAHAPDKRAFLAEAYRLLKPGGKLVIEDLFLFDRPYSETENQALTTMYLPGLSTIPPKSEEFIAWTRNEGFENIEMQDVSRNVLPSGIRMYKIFQYLSLLTNFFYALGLQSELQYRSTHSQMALFRTFKEGLWFMGICSARKPSV